MRREDVPALRLQRVTRVVDGETHLSEIELTFAPGSFNVLLGRTRAGKTSLLRVIAGLDRPDRGRILAGERDVTALHVRERGVAMVYQMFVNYPSLTVFENIASPLRAHRGHRGMAAREIEQRVQEAAELLGLSALLQRLPSELSGGQQQRTAIARAVAKDAPLVLLDEPLANLDYKLREELRVQLRAIFERRGTTVIYTTAEPDEALLLAAPAGTRPDDQTVILDEGRVLQHGPALALYRAPGSERVAQVFSDPELNLLDLEVAPDGSARLGEALLPSSQFGALAPGAYRLGVRADYLRLARSSSADLAITGRTLIDEVTGSSTLLHVAFGARTLTARMAGVQRRALGSLVELFVAPEQLFVFAADGQVLQLTAAGGGHGSH